MKKVIVGDGGHAREVMSQMGVKLDRFVDDQYVSKNTFPLSKLDPNEHEVMIAISDSKVRFDISQRLPKGIKFFTYIHPTSLIMDDVEIGEGSFIGCYSVLTTNIKIGTHSILNRANHIGHDCRIGNFFSAMPGVIVSGNVTIQNLVYIGTNSSIREKIKICDLVTVGLNSGVVKDIVEPGVYVGTPVKKINK